MSRSRTSGAVVAPKLKHRHPLLAAFNQFLDAGFFASLPVPVLRRWSLRTLAIVALLMSVSQAQCLAERFAQARRLVNAWRLSNRAVGRTYQGLVKTLARISPRLLRAMGHHLRPQVQALAGPLWKLGRWVVMGADGSKFNLRRTPALIKGFGLSGKKRCGPQAFLTTILHLATGMVWDARIGKAKSSERAHLRRMLKSLPPDTLLVADAGFVGYDLWRLLSQKIHFLVRVGSNVKLLKKLGYAVRERGDLVYLWPDQNAKAGDPPLVLRLLHFHDGRQDMYLVTDVLDPEELTPSQAKECYRLRWGLELWHRQVKQVAGRAKLASAAPVQATVELAWLVVAMALLGMLSLQEARRRGLDPLAMSPAGVLGALRELASQPQLHGSIRTWRRRLGRCLKDTGPRKAPKCRVKWPAKRQSQPPKPPKILDATPMQIAAAARLTRPQLVS